MYKKYIGPERRKFPRLKIPLFIFYRLETGDSFAMLKAISRNIGGQGLMFEIEKSIPVGSMLYLEIYQPSVKYKDLIFLVSVRARVIWVNKEAEDKRYQIGVEFVEIEKEDKNRIIEYVERINKGW